MHYFLPHETKTVHIILFSLSSKVSDNDKQQKMDMYKVDS